MSSGAAPRDRSLHGRASPWTMGPIAAARANAFYQFVRDVPGIQ
jgi:hypothetical protein